MPRAAEYKHLLSPYLLHSHQFPLLPLALFIFLGFSVLFNHLKSLVRPLLQFLSHLVCSFHSSYLLITRIRNTITIYRRDRSITLLNTEVNIVDSLPFTAFFAKCLLLMERRI